jgi:hypothetical protein
MMGVQGRIDDESGDTRAIESCRDANAPNMRIAGT